MYKTFIKKLQIRTLLTAVFLLIGITSFAQLVGGTVYPINGTENAPTSFGTLKNAISYLTTNGVTGTGQVVLELTGSYDPAAEAITSTTSTRIIIGTISGTSATLGVTIRPATGVTKEISAAMAAGAGIISFEGTSQYVTIDGRQGGTGAIGLTIKSTGVGSAIRFVSSTTNNNTVTYTNLAGAAPKDNANGVVTLFGTSNTVSYNNIGAANATAGVGYGVYADGSTTADNKIANNNIFNTTKSGIFLSSGSAKNCEIDENSIYGGVRNSVTGDVYGIHAVAQDGLQIKNNYIGGTAPKNGGNPFEAGSMSGVNSDFYGIYLSSGTGTTTISGNTIANIKVTVQGTVGNALLGIIATTTSGTVNVLANKIYNIQLTSPNSVSAPVRAIHFAGASTTFNIINNVVSLMQINYSAANSFVYGINISGPVSTANIYFNTIHLSPPSTNLAAVNTSYSLNLHSSITSAHTVNVSNNIMSNTYASGLYRGGSANATFTEKNNLFIYREEAAEVTNATNDNVYTRYASDLSGPSNFNEFFQDAANGQLYVKKYSFGTTENGYLFYHLGTSITGYTKDILGVTRHATPSKGAYENDSETVLPVNISSFTAKLNNNKVQFAWGVGTESNVNRYEVERLQANGSYITVAQVAANGLTGYSATDAQPLLGVNYYRLKSVDNDGTVGYFTTLRDVKVANLKAVTVYPNPVTSNSVVVVLPNGTTELYTYKLVSVAGSVRQKGQFVNNGSNVIALPTLTKGVYTLQITNGTNVIQTKLLKN